MMRSVLIALGLLLIALPLDAQRRWETLEGCRLVSSSSINDGDSFRVRHEGEEYVFRIFFVDAPETSTDYPERVQGQADYFSISFEEALRTGDDATRFARRFLSGTFTVHTDWSDGWGHVTRYRAILEKDGEDLATALVQNGLARVSGFIPDSPWPGLRGSVSDFRRDLEREKEKAHRAEVGAWGYSKERDEPEVEIAETESEDSDGTKVEINSASQTELETLPGIGPVLAGRIIEGRPYRRLTDLVRVHGISTGILGNIGLLANVIAPPVQPNTADYYRENLRYYVNSIVGVSVDQLTLLPGEDAPEGYAVSRASTRYQGQNGGSIRLFAPEDKMKNAQTHYQSLSEPLILRAWLRDYEGEPILVVYP